MNLKLKKTLIERAEARRRDEKDDRDYLQERLFNVKKHMISGRDPLNLMR